jgi:poly(3-hydroxybutyrate) depolymerase
MSRRNGRTGDGQPVIYQLRELNRVMFSPATMLAHASARLFSTPGSWLSQLPGSAGLAAGYELLYRMGKDYEKPEFGIESIEVDGNKIAVIERTVLQKPFCRLQRFKRFSDQPEVVAAMKDDPVVLLVAPLSGHHATLLRDTVRTLLKNHKVYITDWVDARAVPVEQGAFTLGDYVGYLREFIAHIGAERLHVVSVCQATVPVLAAVSLMAAAGEPQPRSITMMGGPIDARRSPTAVTNFALTKPLKWFDNQLVHEVPAVYPGRGRRVYPGFLQHASFIAMNLKRHMTSHWDFYQHLVRGQLEDAEAHRRFYDEYNAVLDLPAEYYLDCIRIVFQQHLLPRGLWEVGGQRVAPESITGSALMTIEGELDDISGLGQTQAAHELCRGVPASRKRHLVVEGAGHYGIFSGRRWREGVYPQIREFIATATPRGSLARR